MRGSLIRMSGVDGRFSLAGHGGNDLRRSTLTFARADGAPDKRRFLALAAFSIFTASNAMQWIALAAVVTEAKAVFALTTARLNALGAVYMIVYCVAAPVMCVALPRLGLRRTVLACAGLNAFGGALKLVCVCVAPHAYGLLFFAQLLCAVAQLGALSVPPQLGCDWFPAGERTLAVSVAAMANNLGTAFGLLAAPQVLGHAAHSMAHHAPPSWGSARAGFVVLFSLLLAPAVLAVLLLAVTPAKPRNAPSAAAARGASASNFAAGGDTPPSYGAHDRASGASVGSEHISGRFSDGGDSPAWHGKALRGGFIGFMGTVLAAVRGLRDAALDPAFAPTLVASSLGIGATWALSNVLTQLLLPFGVTEGEAGAIGFANIAAGSVSAAVVGCVVDRVRRYKGPFVALLFLTTASLALMALAMLFSPRGHAMAVATGAAYVLAGLFQCAIFSVAFEFGVELTFPAPEAVSGTLLMVGGNAIALVLLSIATAMLGSGEVPQPAAAQRTLLLLLFVTSVAGVVGLAAPGLLKRLEYELFVDLSRREQEGEKS